MVGSVKLTGTTVFLSANTPLNNAKCVRVRNIDTVDALITVSDVVLNVTLGNVQIAPNEIIYMYLRLAYVPFSFRRIARFIGARHDLF
jgi:hypothetical protein